MIDKSHTTSEQVQTVLHSSTAPVLPTARNKIRAQLAKVDENTEEGASLVAIWDELNSINDINSLLPHNINQIQLQHDEAQTKYWQRQASMDRHLAKLAKDKSEDGIKLYHNIADRYLKQQTSMQKHLQGMVKTVTKMLGEYNKIMLNRERFVDIVQVMEFRLAVMASINLHVTDQSVRNKIASDMREYVQDYLKAARETVNNGQ